MVFRTFLILFGGAGILLSMATMWQMSDTYHALYGYSKPAHVSGLMAVLTRKMAIMDSTQCLTMIALATISDSIYHSDAFV